MSTGLVAGIQCFQHHDPTQSLAGLKPSSQPLQAEATGDQNYTVQKSSQQSLEMCQFQVEICFKYETHRASQGALVVQNLPANEGQTLRQPSLIPRLGRSPGEENGNLHSSVLSWRIPWTGAWQATVQSHTESDMTEATQQLSMKHIANIQSVVSDSLQPHGLQHAKLPCPSLTPGVCANSCPLSR